MVALAGNLERDAIGRLGKADSRERGAKMGSEFVAGHRRSARSALVTVPPVFAEPSAKCHTCEVIKRR